MPLLSPETLALTLCGFLLGGFSKGLLGMGLPVVAMAVTATTLGVAQTVTLLLAPVVLTNIWQALDGGRLREIVTRLWPFYLGAILGTLIGGALAAGSPEHLLLGLLGGMLMVYAALALMAVQPPPPGRAERWLGPAAALVGGVMFGMVGNFIVPGLMFLQSLRLPRDMMVQALGVTFVVISATLALSRLGQPARLGDLAALSGLATAAAFLGMAAGRRCRRYVPESAFRQVFLVALLLIGARMLYGAA